jgi:hypothetical protein
VLANAMTAPTYHDGILPPAVHRVPRLALVRDAPALAPPEANLGRAAYPERFPCVCTPPCEIRR